MTELKTMSRRSFLRKGGKVLLGLLATGAIGAYPFVGERFWYQTKQVHLPIHKLPKAFEDWKVVQFSDIHFGFYYGVEQFRRVAEIINALKPDILFFTGDLVHQKWPDLPSAIPLLRQLRAPRGGKWAVLGNHDFMPKEQVIQALEGSEFIVLQNNYGFITQGADRLYIAGVKDALYDNPNIESALQQMSDQDCILLLAHEPDIADLSSRYGFAAQFSGHSHGGQVRLPFYGSVVTPELAKKYVDGLYEIGESKMPLYVNRGIGSTQIPMRLFCRPEITVFYLHAKS
jgi:predicted MPP superfamily phosphohydrolase